MQRLSTVSICGAISLGRSLMISSGHLVTPCDSASSTLIIERRFVFLSKARTGTAKLYATMHCREAPPVGTGRGKLAAYNQALPIEWLFLTARPPDRCAPLSCRQQDREDGVLWPHPGSIAAGCQAYCPYHSATSSRNGYRRYS